MGNAAPGKSLRRSFESRGLVGIESNLEGASPLVLDRLPGILRGARHKGVVHGEAADANAPQRIDVTFDVRRQNAGRCLGRA